jgi:cyanophycin synthetase
LNQKPKDKTLMRPSIKIRNLRLFPGARGGLSEKTAIITFEFAHEFADWPSAETRLRNEASLLCPAEPLWGIEKDDWPGAFLTLPEEPTTFAHWVVALTIAMLRWARDPVWQGRVLAISGNSITLALPWEREPIFKTALQLALRHLLLWTQPHPDTANGTQLSKAFEQWLLSVQPGGLAPNTLRFALAARQRNIPVSVSIGMLRLGWGAHMERMDSSFTGRTGNLAARIARQKLQTTRVLQEGGVPVPRAALSQSWDKALDLAKKLNWPVVIKPSNQDQGAGVVPGICDEETLRRAFDGAAKLSPGAVIVEKHIAGDDHRMLVVGGKLLMATKRIPGGVTGDGMSAVAQLVAQVNADPRRGTSKRSMLIALTLDEEAQRCLAGQKLTVESVPAAGRFVHLRQIANISAGGTAEDVTTKVHPDNRVVAERAARLVGLDIAGVDLLCPDISRSWREVGGAVCEVNGQPGFRPHWLGDPGRDINGEIIEWLFRDKTSRIPSTAITGTNGKSTTAQMLHHIWLAAGKMSGVCTTQGVWIGRDKISSDNLSGFPGGRMLLTDPSVEAAVIEMPRKGLIVFGHPCDAYDVAALMNVQDDHVGIDGINSLEEMARLKSEVLTRASEAVVINAEDSLCMAMRPFAKAQRQILVARDGDLPVLLEHRRQGGEGVFSRSREDSQWIIYAQGDTEIPLVRLADIPATMNGLLGFNEINGMFAAALACAHRIDHDAIQRGLMGFANSAAQNPGRCNFIKGHPFQILLDYAHNSDGVRTLCQVVTQIPARRKILVCLNLGNRSAAHIQASAPLLAPHFDHFVLGQDAARVLHCKDYAGDDPKEAMLKYFFEQMRTAGLAENQLDIERDESGAILRGLAVAGPGDLLVLMAEEHLALPLLRNMSGHAE